MSRSLHTQKLELRAARRMARPHGTRAADGALLRRRMTAPAQHVPQLPIQRQRPAPGCLHPLQPDDIREAIEAFGCTPFYGLKRICLRHACDLTRTGLVFAEYLVPDEIHLYAVPAPPWRLPFLPPDADLETFARYGARCVVDPLMRRATVEWPPDALRDFFRFEVLAHELGHHVLQHNQGKRPAQIRRRRDHEAYADLYARRARHTATRQYANQGS